MTPSCFVVRSSLRDGRVRSFEAKVLATLGLFSVLKFASTEQTRFSRDTLLLRGAVVFARPPCCRDGHLEAEVLATLRLLSVLKLAYTDQTRFLTSS